MWPLCMEIIAMQTSDSDAVKGARVSKFDTDSFSIGVDNRCSGCISHRIEDFEGRLIDTDKSVRGFGGTKTHNIKIGTIKWQWLDDKGAYHEFRIPKSYYIPSGKVRLLSPQHWARTIAGNNRDKGDVAGETTTRDKTTLFWGGGKYTLTIPMCIKTNVATFQTAPGYRGYQLFCQQAELHHDSKTIIATPSVAEPPNDAIKPPSRVIESIESEWHAPNDKNTSEVKLTGKLEATGRDKEMDLRRENLASEFLDIHCRAGHTSFGKLQEMARQGIIPKRFATCAIPVCAACMYGQATRRRWRDKPSKVTMEKPPLAPGDKVSVDQMVSPTPGLVAQMTGILTTKRYRYATVYIDQASRMGFTYLQKTSSAEETIQSKRAFEAFAKNRGVTIKSYHADNGIFRANQWLEDCRAMKQPITFAGVAAHHQNGYAERRIRTLQEMARTMLIHGNRRWSKAITTQLWPYALRMANSMLNEVPNMQDRQRRTPEQIFTSTKVQSNSKHWHTFGCPVYVLDSDLQTGKPFHKWRERSRIGIYLGRSPHHARNVGLVLDRETGLVSPQFHLVYDSSFSSIQGTEGESLWQLKAGFLTRSQAIDHHLNQLKGDGAGEDPHTQTESTIQREAKRRRVDEEIARSKTITMNQERDMRLQNRAARKAEASRKMESQLPKRVMNTAEVETVAEGAEIFAFESMIPHGQREVESCDEPLLALKAVADPDTMYWHQAMKEPDSHKFREAMEKEVNDQYKNGNFSIVPRSTIPSNQRIFPAVWQMRRKRDIRSRKIKKYKARLNLDGSRMQHGIDYEETYAPVTSWRSIRMLLTLVALYGWYTVQLDYVLAFPQAPAERELYMAIPKGFVLNDGCESDYALRIHKNIYGQKQAGRVWNHYLAKKLQEDAGFVQSKVDECLFYRGRVIYALYTDDSILAGPNQKEVEAAIDDIKKAGLDITIEGTLEDFLARYLKGTRNKGIVLKPTHDKELEVHVDADFAGAWDPKESEHRDTARSRHGYIISYKGCPLLWKSQLQTEIALSSTESEYTGLSYALRDAIPVMQTLKEMQERWVPIKTTHGKVYCNVFEDNSGAVEMATHHKYRPRTKHLNVKLHHFRDYVNRKEISVHHISTQRQPADLLTKSLNEELTRRHREVIMGW